MVGLILESKKMTGTWRDMEARGNSQLGQLLTYLLGVVSKRTQQIYMKRLKKWPHPVAGLFFNGDKVYRVMQTLLL